MKTKIIFFLLVIIIIAGAALRFYGLSISPPSLNWDEAAFGYNAFSISQTGKDEYGQFLPIFTRSFDEYKPALPIYLMIPFVKLFGLNEMGVRTLPAFSGTILIFLLFLIARKIFHSNAIALLSAFLLAISPFSVFFSRVMFEGMTALLFFMLGFLLYLYKDKKIAFFFSILFFLLAMYSYNSYKMLVPIFLVIDWFLFSQGKLNFKKLGQPFYIVSCLIFFLLFLPLLLLSLTGEAVARFQTTSILNLSSQFLGPGLSSDHKLAPIVNFYIHNQNYYFLWELAGRYLSYFSPMNLFIRESVEATQHIPYLSVFYPFQFIFWLIGMVVLLRRAKVYKTLLLLVFLTPLPAIITWNWFHPVRVLPLLATFSLVMAFGASICLECLRKIDLRIFHLKSIIWAIFFYLSITLLGIWSALFLFDSLIVVLPMIDYGNWQPGFRESIPIIGGLSKQYEEVIIDTPQAQPYIFTLFYQAYPPAQYLSEIDYQKIAVAPRNYYDFGKYKFRKIYWPTDRLSHKKLFMGTVFSLPEKDIFDQPNAKIIKDIVDKGGNVSVRIVALD